MRSSTRYSPSIKRGRRSSSSVSRPATKPSRPTLTPSTGLPKAAATQRSTDDRAVSADGNHNIAGGNPVRWFLAEGQGQAVKRKAKLFLHEAGNAKLRKPGDHAGRVARRTRLGEVRLNQYLHTVPPPFSTRWDSSTSSERSGSSPVRGCASRLRYRRYSMFPSGPLTENR